MDAHINALFHVGPFQRCEIYDCGEIKPGESFGITDDDGTKDIFPQFPEDSNVDFTGAPVSTILSCSVIFQSTLICFQYA